MINTNSGQPVSYQRFNFTKNDSYCEMTSIYTIIENNVILSSTNNSLGMRYDPTSNPLTFYFNPLSNSLAGTYTLKAMVYPT